jgi:hypothetical protein
MSYSRQRLNEVVALQKAILTRIEADLGEFGNSRRRKYIQEFHDEFQTFETKCAAEDVLDAAADANLVWIGDYHALVRSRAYAVDLLRKIAARRNSKVAIGVEVVFARQQKILDRWMHDEITDPEFLEQIRYFEQWGCDWPSYKILFDAAKELNIPAYGVDYPRADMRRIGRRDQAVAHRICRLMQEDPSRTLVVLFGESHLASNHLPRRVRRVLEKQRVSCKEVLVLQNVDAIYWELQRKGLEGVRSVRIQPEQYCVFNATPMEKYESFRQYLLSCVQDEGKSDWTRFVHTLIDVIFDFLDIDKQPDLMDYLPKVYSEISADRLPRFLLRQEIPAAQARLAADAIQTQGASYIPELNSMFIDEFRLDYTTEEAARFIHQLCRGEFHQNSVERAASDLFFVSIIERAFGYFFSKLLDSSRDGIATLGDRLLQYIGYNEELARTVSCLLDPEKRPSWRHFERLRTAVEQNPSRSRMLHMLSQVLGYALGRRLHKAYLESRISRKEIQALLHDPLLAPDRPLECYAELSVRLT